MHVKREDWVCLHAVESFGGGICASVDQENPPSNLSYLFCRRGSQGTFFRNGGYMVRVRGFRRQKRLDMVSLGIIKWRNRRTVNTSCSTQVCEW